MNKGLPNASSLLAKTLVVASGITGPFGWILQKVLAYVLAKASVQFLIMADQIHVAVLVKAEVGAFDGAIDKAFSELSDGLTQEQRDAIDKPVMDAFIKLARFRLRGDGKNP